eukprot:7429922-Pyramimonas_sp.AAC.1
MSASVDHLASDAKVYAKVIGGKPIRGNSAPVVRPGRHSEVNKEENTLPWGVTEEEDGETPRNEFDESSSSSDEGSNRKT